MPSEEKQQDIEVAHFPCPSVFFPLDCHALGCPTPTLNPLLRGGERSLLWVPFTTDAPSGCFKEMLSDVTLVFSAVITKYQRLVS